MGTLARQRVRQFLITPNEVSDAELPQAFETMYGGKARPSGQAPVNETFQGRPVGQGIVHVFDLEGHPTASRCYAWSSPIEGTGRRRFYAVLHESPADSPAAAVRAAIEQIAGKFRHME